MALKTETAQAWMKASAIMLLIGACNLVLQAVALPFIGYFFPSPSIAEAGLGSSMSLVINFFAAFAFIVVAGVYLVLGLGIWNYRPAVRTVMIVLGWLGAAFTIIFLLGGVVLLLVGGAASSPEFAGSDATSAGELAVAGVMMLVLGLLFIPFTIIHLWLFQFEPTVRELFSKGTTVWRPVVDARNAASIVRGFGINLWVSAILFSVLGVLILGGGIFLASGAMPDIPADIISPALILAVGALFLIGGVLSVVIGVGVWRLRVWSRTGLLVLMWLGFVGNAAYVISMPVLGSTPDAIANAVVGLVFSLALVIFLTKMLYNTDIRAAFGVTTPTAKSSVTPRLSPIAQNKQLVQTKPSAQTKPLVQTKPSKSSAQTKTPTKKP